MCGLTGFLQLNGFSSSKAQVIVRNMADSIAYRGPNDVGVWTDEISGVAFAHRRLSILDLSSSGHQPMVSANGRYTIVFNGEIYNHLNLRKELDATSVLSAVESDEMQSANSIAIESGGNLRWNGNSDTETLLASFEAWGVEATLKKSIGMFAIALWDHKMRTLTLARDRVGEKPLYYGWQGVGSERVFLFGSELKALKAHPAFAATINRGALSLLLRHSYIPAPYSIYQDVAKLEPGCLLSICLANFEPKIRRYWDASEVALAGLAKPFGGTKEEAADELEVLLKDAVRQQMVADVPLGAFLSGGIDSSLVVALMQAQSSLPVKTFTIGFHEQGYNEAVHSKAVARHLGADHTELYVTPKQALEVIPNLPSLYCEPFADSSQVPTFLLSQLAKQHVTVSLSGDAGDELFCGYNRYKFTENLWKKISFMPPVLRSLLSKSITGLSPTTWDVFASIVPGVGHGYQLGNKLHKAASLLNSVSADKLYLNMVSHLSNPADWVIDGYEPPTHLTGLSPDLDALGPVERMMLLDTISYLPDDILAKVDRSAMAVSLETRVPFLDHRVVEFAWTLPQNYKMREGQTKWPLRQILYRYVPRELIDRPKMGFGIPIHDWLRGPLREWAECLLNEDRLLREGYFNPTLIRKIWSEHLSGHRNWITQLWNILMFQAWLEMEQGG